MTTIVTRTTVGSNTGKGSPLTHTEVDTNFVNLNTAKLETGAIPLGTLQAPSVSFLNDSDTGIFCPQGGNSLAIATGGQYAITCSSTQAVGIKTANPQGALQVAGSTRIGANDATDAFLEIGEGATGNRNSYIDIVGDTTYTDYGLRVIRNNTGANATSELKHRGTGALNFTTEEAAPIVFNTTNSPALTITSGGLVGIGTSSPSYNLDVAGSTARIKNTSGSAELILSRNTNGAGATISLNTGDTNKWYFGLRGLVDDKFYIVNNVASNTALTIDESSRVGIGTSSPNKLLHIYGGASDTEIRLQSNSGTEQNAYFTLRNSGGKLDIYSVNGDIALNPGNSVAATFKSDGKVGIGVTSPGVTLDLSAATAATRITSSTGTTPAYTQFTNAAGNAYVGIESSTGGGAAAGNAPYALHLSHQGAYPINFSTNNALRATIDSSGRLLVGTTNDAGSSSNRIVVGSNGICGVKKTFTNLDTTPQSFGFQANNASVYVAHLQSVSTSSVAFLIACVYDTAVGIVMATTALGRCTAGGTAATISGINGDARTYTFQRDAGTGEFTVTASAVATGSTVIALTPLNQYL